MSLKRVEVTLKGSLVNVFVLECLGEFVKLRDLVLRILMSVLGIVKERMLKDVRVKLFMKVVRLKVSFCQFVRRVKLFVI